MTPMVAASANLPSFSYYRHSGRIRTPRHSILTNVQTSFMDDDDYPCGKP